MFEEPECGADDGELTLAVTGGAQRATHRVLCDQRPSDAHQLRYMSEAPDVDADRRDPGRLDGSLDVSDRHVADRSNRHEQHGVDTVVGQALRPRRPDVVAESGLRRSADE